VKLHAAIEMKWRSIVSFHFTRTYVHEITQLEQLLEPLYDLGDVYADSGALKRKLGGYVSSIKRNIQHVEIALKIIVYNLMILARKIVEEEYF